MNRERRPRVLVVDDERVYLSILAEVLGNDYVVSVARSGVRALEICRSDTPPDLILLDVNMPDMDGNEVCRQLKSEKVTKDIPVIFITTNTEEEDEKRGLELGAVDYITKPFRLPIVLARVRTHVELKLKSDALERLSHMDGLTQIANRMRFDDAFEREWRQGLRERKPMSLLMIDIDYFKNFNDHYGHGSGDECLRRVARCMVGFAQRPRDLVARYGGEEFVGLFPQTDLHGAERIGEAMRTSVEALAIPHAYSLVSPHVTISLGLASVTPSRDSPPSLLLESADQALYLAKRASRNTLRCIALETGAPGFPESPSPGPRRRRAG